MGIWRAPISNSFQEFLLRSDPTDQGPPLPVGFEQSLTSLSRESPQCQPTPPRVETTLAFRPRGRERLRSPLARSSRRCTSPRRDDYRHGGTGFGSSSLGRSRGVMAVSIHSSDWHSKELEQDIINPSSYGCRRRRRSRSQLMRNSRRSASPREDRRFAVVVGLNLALLVVMKAHELWSRSVPPLLAHFLSPTDQGIGRRY